MRRKRPILSVESRRFLVSWLVTALVAPVFTNLAMVHKNAESTVMKRKRLGLSSHHQVRALALVHKKHAVDIVFMKIKMKLIKKIYI